MYHELIYDASAPIIPWSATRHLRSMPSNTLRAKMRFSGSKSLCAYPCVPQKLTAWSICSFAAAFSKLMELGVPTSQFVTSEPWIMKNVGEKE